MWKSSHFVRIIGLAAVFVTVGIAALVGHAASFVPTNLEENVKKSDAVFRGTVVSVTCFADPADGGIYTRVSFRVDEAIKGRLPAVVDLVHFGGDLEEISVQNGFAPRFQVGQERLVFAARRPNGTLSVVGGETGAAKLERSKPTGKSAGPDFIPAHRALLNATRAAAQASRLPEADLTDQASAAYVLNQDAVVGKGRGGGVGIESVTGLFVDANGISSRFIKQDRGEAIPYVVDATLLPSGITTNQAMSAISNALAAWTAVTSLKFTFAGFQNFGMPSERIEIYDGKLRIQLYDYTNYLALNYPGTLGIGGRYALGPLLSGAGWGRGGNVAGNEFHLTGCGFVMLNHTNASLRNVTNLAEILCHEIGHALSLDHSTDPQSIMYPYAHFDGRGAQLAASDVPVVRQAYPQANTPPFSFDRVMDIVTGYIQPNVPGINEVQLRGYDLQSKNLTLFLTNKYQVSGYFALAGSLLQFLPDDCYSSPRLDPAGSAFYDCAFFRFSDGTNASPYTTVRTISFEPDTAPLFEPDGLPDSWMQGYFGDSDPQAGPNRGPYDDYDGDGMNNINEYRAGMNPTDPKSCQRIRVVNADTVEWQAKPYELYELEYSTNFTQWTRAGNPVLPTTTNAVTSGLSALPGPVKFFRVLKVP